MTQAFFEEYKERFFELRRLLTDQCGDSAWARACALQLLNRLMFLYFIQRKGWLGERTDFMPYLWRTYRATCRPADSFYAEWLKPFFFEAFTNHFQDRADRQYLPMDVRKAMAEAPYLNGGLFTENSTDRAQPHQVPDSFFERLFHNSSGHPGLLERYNFTVSESTPLDVEVAVDPEMIGHVYESLVHLESGETDEQPDARLKAGIFYTPRVEIDLMSRLALVDCLANHLGQEHQALLYEVVFAQDHDEKTEADKKLSEADLWPRLNQVLRDITVCDPACGSGSFLVGMLLVLDDLLARADRELGEPRTAYQRRRAIIGASLYGADVMEWSVRVAELRLWLQLAIETDLEPAERHLMPLLPNLTFKLRPGDSLVQEVGGVNLNLHGDSAALTPGLKGKLTTLKGRKLHYFDGRDAVSEAQIRHEERALFLEILRSRVLELQRRRGDLLLALAARQERMFAASAPAEGQRQQAAELVDVESHLAAASRAKEALESNPRRVPFVWDLAFAEVFHGDERGFDIVVGNPPYVRQERIAPPETPDAGPEQRKAYKDELQRSVWAAYPHFFGYDRNKKEGKGNPRRKLDGKSDLYVYFYLHGLSLLNEKGSFCFITSNSWLDVGYGAELQEFLLKHSHVTMVLDNQKRRSFFQADVNTVIALLGPPDDRHERGLSKTARFVSLRVPFEQVLSPVIFQEVEEARERRTTAEYRVFPVSQLELLDEGMARALPEDGRAPALPAGYAGNKWGGKFLRAPDIYHTVLEKGKPYVGTLSTYFRGERYLNTGGADGFFILTDVRPISEELVLVSNARVTHSRSAPFVGELETHYLRPLVKDYTKKDRRIEIHGYDAYCFVAPGATSVRAREYIQWGESQGYNKRSVTISQKPWYKPTRQMTCGAGIVVPRSFGESFVIHWNPNQYLTLRFYRLHAFAISHAHLAAYLNTTLTALFIETLGNTSLGQGVLDFFMADFLAMRVPIILGDDLLAPFAAMKERPIQNVYYESGVPYGGLLGGQSPHPPKDRSALDAIVFDALDLTQAEREGVYEALAKLVRTRLERAESLSGRRRVGEDDEELEEVEE